MNICPHKSWTGNRCDRCGCERFDAPDKLCQWCGKIIPTNGYELNPDGTNVLDENGSPVWRERAEIVCETCARNAAPPVEPKRRRRRGEKIEGQMEIEAPTLVIT